MIYRVTLPGYFALHTADSALADAWKNHFGGTVAQIHLGDIKSVSADQNAASNILREGLRLHADPSTPRSGGIEARGESSSASAATPMRLRTRRTANSSTGRAAASPRRAGMEPARQGVG